MFEREARISRQMIKVFRGIMRDFDAANFTQSVSGAKNPPAYVVAHLAVVNDMGLMMLGQPPVCPREWHTVFGPGSDPSKVPFPYPSKAELCGLFEQGAEKVAAAAITADPAAMDRPHGIAMFEGSEIATVGDVVALLLTSHMALHFGQLSVMRRQLGFTPLF